MHAANSHLHAVGKIALASVLSARERSVLSDRLLDDARDYYQAAAVSFVDGVNSIKHGFYSWSTVKLYYCAFYALRARLAIAGECIFYDGSKPRYINTNPGATVSKLSGTTHACVVSTFATCFPSDFFLSQEIDLMSPLLWLMARREEVNYRHPRFTEPIAPPYFRFVASEELRKLLTIYASDDVYIFDPDHAMVAFPFRLLLYTRERLSSLNITPLKQDECDFLAQFSRDATGLITAVKPLIS